jgi:pantoate--beta-alanine ligase
MKIIETIAELRAQLQPHREGVIGFVPTMGYLHQGHLSLVGRAREECDLVVMSIFVNPTQFGPQEDFATYPRDFERDRRFAEKAGVDLLFVPSRKEMYPRPSLTKIEVQQVTERLCGASRPGHFEGVALVVSKLFHIVEPNRAYFGLKDAQQVAVIEQMVYDLSMPVQIVPCPTVREPDGLAMSSRNVRLTPEQREQAATINQVLQEVKQQEWETAAAINEYVRQRLETLSLAKVDYVETLCYPSLEPIDQLAGERVIVAVAVYFGSTRLIDNLIIQRGEK